MLFLFNWRRNAAIPAAEDDHPVIGSATADLKVKQKRRRLSLSKPLRDIDFPMHEVGEDEDLLIMLGVV